MAIAEWKIQAERLTILYKCTGELLSMAFND